MNDMAYGIVFGLVGGMMVNICIKVKNTGLGSRLCIYLVDSLSF